MNTPLAIGNLSLVGAVCFILRFLFHCFKVVELTADDPDGLRGWEVLFNNFTAMRKLNQLSGSWKTPTEIRAHARRAENNIMIAILLMVIAIVTLGIGGFLQSENRIDIE